MRMNRLTRVAALSVAALLGGTLAACSSSGTGGGGEGDSAKSNKLVIYSPNNDQENQTLMQIIEDQFPGIEIEMVNGNAGELTARIGAESSNPQGDLMWGGLTMQDGDTHADLFEHWLTEHEAELPDAYRSPNGFYHMDSIQPAMLMVNEDVEAELGVTIDGYEDLLDPRLEGRIIINDPLSSSSALSSISAIHTAFGLDSDESWDYIEALLNNGLVIAPSSSAIVSGVADGEYAVSLAWESGPANLLKSGVEHVRLVYPEEGTSAQVYGIAVIKDAPNMETVKEVVTYLMSADGQRQMAENAMRRVTMPDAPLDPMLPSTDEINWIDRDWPWLIENQDQLKGKWEELFMEHHS